MLDVDIEKSLGRFHLSVKFQTHGENILALLGSSGSGKSMTLKCIAGIEKPDRGRIVVDDRVLFDSEQKINLTPQQRRVGYLFQQYALFPNLSVFDNVYAGIGEEKENAEGAVRQMLDRLQLKGLEKHYPDQLSGGQQQRVALARILVNHPDVLLLDEPFSALDGYLKWKLEFEMYELLSEFDGSIILVSHDSDEVHRISDSVVVLSQGKSETKYETGQLFQNPRTYSAAKISGCKNFSGIRRLEDHELHATDWNVNLRVKEKIESDIECIGVRSQYLKPVDTPGENVLRCRVIRAVEEIGYVTLVLQPEQSNAKIWASMDGMEWKKRGNPETIFVEILPEYIMLLRK